MKKNESSLTLLMGVMLLIGAPISFYAANALSILGSGASSDLFDVASLVFCLIGVSLFVFGVAFLIAATLRALASVLLRWTLSIKRRTSGA